MPSNNTDLSRTTADVVVASVQWAGIVALVTIALLAVLPRSGPAGWLGLPILVIGGVLEILAWAQFAMWFRRLLAERRNHQTAAVTANRRWQRQPSLTALVMVFIASVLLLFIAGHVSGTTLSGR